MSINNSALNTVYPKDFNKYELIEIIDSGASADVQTARCFENDEIIAIKRINLKKADITLEDLLVVVYLGVRSIYKCSYS
jgi:hypothetical protein